MRKVVKLKESDLKKIITLVLEQKPLIQRYSSNDPANAPSDYLGKQGVLGQQQRKQQENYKIKQLIAQFPCVPQNVQFFPVYVKNNKEELMKKLGVDDKTLVFLTKVAIGIIGRETSFGKGTDWEDDATEWLHNQGLGFIPDIIQKTYNISREALGYKKQTKSLGAAQFTPETWERYNLNTLVGPFHKSYGATKQGLGTMFRLISDYRTAIANGAGTGPSVNPIAKRQGKITNIRGTGNNAWDLSIVSHNMAGLLTAWCETSDPNYAAPCDKSTYQPFPDTKKEIVLTVNRNKKIPNYFPNKGSGALRSIGYLEEVSDYIKQFGCINF